LRRVSESARRVEPKNVYYSCFDPKAGQYDYYEDGTQLAINADLPVPRLPPMAGKVGVPAIDAGRPLPSAAKRVGKGWHARGLIVQCGRGSSALSGLGAVFESDSVKTALVVAGLAAVTLWAFDVPKSWWAWSPKAR
jgi:hypothetical protein